MTSPIDIVGTGVYSPKLRQAAVVRRQLSRGGSGTMGVVITGPAGPLDAESVALKVFRKDDWETYAATDVLGVLVLDVAPDDPRIVHQDTGRYVIDIGPDLTADRGYLNAVWTYSVAATVFTYVDSYMVLDQMPVYEQLSDYEQGVVEQVSFLFADLFDSTEGGPNLTENFQTHFGYERIAQLMHFAVQRMNVTGVVITDWAVGSVAGTPLPEQARGLLLLGTYMEVLRHLMRSYVEQPLIQNANGVTYTDRRDYYQRWKTIYDDEKPTFDKALAQAKRAALGGLSGGALLVAGGIYGTGSRGIFMPGLYAAQTRGWRFLPAAGAISIVNALNGPHSGPWG